MHVLITPQVAAEDGVPEEDSGTILLLISLYL